MKEMHTRREKIKIGQREQASKINVRGGKIQNNKVRCRNFYKEGLWSRGVMQYSATRGRESIAAVRHSNLKEKRGR